MKNSNYTPYSNPAKSHQTKDQRKRTYSSSICAGCPGLHGIGVRHIQSLLGHTSPETTDFNTHLSGILVQKDLAPSMILSIPILRKIRPGFVINGGLDPDAVFAEPVPEPADTCPDFNNACENPVQSRCRDLIHQ